MLLRKSQQKNESEPKMSRSCTCKKCIECCNHQPGWFLPGEAEKAAEHLNMTFDDFKNEFLVIEYWVGGAMVYAPRKKYQPKGCIVAAHSDAFIPGKCVFLDKNSRCRIHTVKPAECKEVMACQSGKPKINRNKIQKAYAKLGDPLA